MRHHPGGFRQPENDTEPTNVKIHAANARHPRRTTYAFAVSALVAVSIITLGSLTEVPASAATPTENPGAAVTADGLPPESGQATADPVGSLHDVGAAIDATTTGALSPTMLAVGSPIDDLASRSSAASAGASAALSTGDPATAGSSGTTTVSNTTIPEITAPSNGITSPDAIMRPASAAGFAAALNIVMPGSLNTGVPLGTKLTRYVGDLTITRAGTVIDSLEVFGLVRVEAANVTIRRSLIHGRAVTGSSALIYAGAASVQNLRVEDSELAAANPSPNINGIYGSHFTLLRVNIHNVVDSVHIFGDSVTVQDSWLHNNLHFASDPNFGGGPSHDDNVQIQKGANLNFIGNTMSGAYNSVMQITQGQGVTSLVNFKNNWISGGACTLNISQEGVGTAIKGLVLFQNVFGSSRYNCQVIIDRSSVAGTVFNGNLTLASIAPKIQVR